MRRLNSSIALGALNGRSLGRGGMVVAVVAATFLISMANMYVK
jgi:hypothetical protein